MGFIAWGDVSMCVLGKKEGGGGVLEFDGWACS